MLFTHAIAYANGPGDAAPNKCSATDIEYTVSNVVPNGVCNLITDTINVAFDVNIWGNPTRYNVAVGYTNAGDNILQDVSCLDTGIDIDSVGCNDYDGSGTVAAPLVASSSFDVSCDLDGNLLVDPLVGVDFYASFDANSGGTVPAINSPKCSLQEGTTFPLTPASLQLNKIVINDSGGSAAAGDWTLTADMGAGATTLSGPSGIINNDLPAGDYVLSETGPAGYVLTGVSCTGAIFDAATSTVTLQPDDIAVCEFTNDDETVTTSSTTLTLIKTIINDHGGAAVVEDFDIAIDGVEVVSGAVNAVASGVDIIISELVSPAYQAGSWNCVDSTGLTTSLPTAGLAASTTLNLVSGSAVVCSIENNDKGVDLSVSKTVNNTRPSIGDEITFELLVSNAGPDDATGVVLVDVLPAGFSYVSGSIAGGDIRIDTDPLGAGLNWTINSLPATATSLLSFKAIVLAP